MKSKKESGTGTNSTGHLNLNSTAETTKITSLISTKDSTASITLRKAQANSTATEIRLTLRGNSLQSAGKTELEYLSEMLVQDLSIKSILV